MRKRAKHRLIGAVVLVLIGVVGFPLVFDTAPRPLAVDIPIEIPSKTGARPLALPAPPITSATPPAAVQAGPVPDAASLSSREEIVRPNTAASPAEPAPAATPTVVTSPKPEPEPKPPAKPEPKPEPKPDPKPKPSASNEAARAAALLSGQPVPVPVPEAATPAEVRLVVQVGAFSADTDRAKEVRQKLERAGFKTYTQVVDTKDGKRIRVRVGPFANRAEAEKAAEKIKALDLPAAILTL